MKFVGNLLTDALLLLCLLAVAAQSGSSGAAATTPDLREHLATRLFGRVVENQDAVDLGKLKDVLVEAETGRPTYAVISSGGLKPHRKLVPATALSLATAKRSVLFLQVPSQEWAKAPAFKKSELPNLGKLEVISQVYGFYGVAPNATRDDAAPSKPGANRLSQTGVDPGPTAASEVSVRSCSAIIGEGVYDMHRETLGTITDLLLDLSGRNPTMAIVSAKSLLKSSECFAVPLSSLTLSKENKLVSNASRTNLQQAVLLTQRSWHQAANRDAIYRCPAR